VTINLPDILGSSTQRPSSLTSTPPTKGCEYAGKWRGNHINRRAYLESANASVFMAEDE
jgi:hypothetical protein